MATVIICASYHPCQTSCPDFPKHAAKAMDQGRSTWATYRSVPSPGPWKAQKNAAAAAGRRHKAKKTTQKHMRATKRAKAKKNLQCRTRREKKKEKADSTLRTSQAVPHPSTIRALSHLTSEVERDPVY